MPQSVCHMAGVSLPQPFEIAGCLTEDELAPFAEFKQRLSDVAPELDDITLVRFMRADACKLDKSEARLRATLAWRAARNVDGVLDNPPRHGAEYQRLRIRSWMGEDVQGRPVQFERLGAFFGSGNCGAFTREEWLQATLWDMERLMAKLRDASVKRGSTVQEYCFIADVTGCKSTHRTVVPSALEFSATDWERLTAKRLPPLLDELVNGMKTIPLLQTLTEEVECHYPEIAGAIVLFNCPSMLTSLFNRVVKPFMDPITAAKVEMHVGVPLDRLRELLGSDDNIPVCYGGRNTTAFPETEIWQGDLKQPREGEHAVTVGAGAAEEFTHEIEGGMTVTWGLRVVEYNVKYTAVFEPHGSAVIELGATAEGGKDDHAEGMFASEGPGRLVIRLSNEHSWMRGKSCFVSVDQVPAPQPKPAAAATVAAGGALDESIDVGALEPEPEPAAA